MVGFRLPQRAKLGVSIGSQSIHAVLLDGEVVRWAGQAAYTDFQDLADVVARLAAEPGRPVRTVSVVLERSVVQVRSIVPGPRLKPKAARRYVSLDGMRLFRKNGVSLVTDGCVVSTGGHECALYAAAVFEPLVQEVLRGCTEAGLRVEALGPAADVLPASMALPRGTTEVTLPNANSSEVLSIGPAGTWRSRLVAASQQAPPCFVPALAAFGDEASHFAAAYAAAITAPRLDLLPPDTRAVRLRHSRRRHLRVAAIGAILWLLAGGVYVERLGAAVHNSRKYLASVAAALDSALAQRRDLRTGEETLATIARGRSARSRNVGLLADLSTALGDSAFLVALRIGSDGTVRLAGYAPSAARVMTTLDSVRELSDAKLEGPVTRESPAGIRPIDRFSIVAHLVHGLQP